jgi:hypothetical protein
LCEGGTIKVEELADAALGAFNFAVYLVSGQVDKPRRGFGQKRLEPQPLFQFGAYGFNRFLHLSTFRLSGLKAAACSRLILSWPLPLLYRQALGPGQWINAAAPNRLLLC